MHLQNALNHRTRAQKNDLRQAATEAAGLLVDWVLDGIITWGSTNELIYTNGWILLLLGAFDWDIGTVDSWDRSGVIVDTDVCWDEENMGSTISLIKFPW